MTGTLTPITDGTGTLTSIANSTLTLAVENANTTTYPAEVMADNPVGYWRLEEASGGFEDSSGNGNHGSPNGGITYGTAGEVGNAVTLNGTTGYINVPDANSLDVGDVFTLECWLKPVITGVFSELFDKGANAFQVRFTATGGIRLLQAPVTSIVVSTTVVPADGLWHHIVVTKNGATVHQYIDAVDVTGAVANQTLVSNAVQLTFGAKFDGSADFYQGGLDEVAIYATALSQARVTAHYLASGGGLTLSSRTDNSLVLTPA